jgi:hypothetical protein
VSAPAFNPANAVAVDDPAAFNPSNAEPVDAAPAAPQQTAMGAAQAGASGLNAGSADLLGLPVDTARNVLELGKAGLGFVYHEATGNDIPQALQPSETPDVGSSAWIKDTLRKMQGNNAVDVAENTTANRLLHGAAEAVPSSLVGGEANTVPSAARAAVGGAAAGTAQQGAAEAGLPGGYQAAAGLLGGAAAAHVTGPKVPSPADTYTAARDTYTAPTAAPSPTAAATKFEPAPPLTAAPGAASGAPYTDLEGAPPRMNIGGQSTAADTARTTGIPVPEVAKPQTAESAEPQPVVAAPAEQSVREQTLRDIGLTEARDSAVTGDTKATGTDFQTAKLDNAAGDRMSGVIDNERQALQNYAGQLTDATGGSRGVDNASLYQRGEAMAKPVEQLGDYFDQKIKDAYGAATQEAGTDPIDTPKTGDFIKNERAQFLATVEGKQLREGVLARMRDLGMMDEEGNVQPASIPQIERLRQFVGDAYTPRTGRLIGQLKDALDDDVTKAAGTNVYAAARDTRSLRSKLLDDPTGIAKLAPPDDRLGINRAVPLEQVPDYVTNLPVDQFAHVVSTLRNVPPDAPLALHQSAATALNEMRSHFANNVEKAGNSTQGMWNTKGVNEYLNKNQLKMAEVFSPEELGRFKTLADAGNILKMDRTYSGPAIAHNLAVRGVLGAVEKAAHGAGTALGAAVGVHVGAPEGFAVAGSAAGSGVSKIASKISDKALLSRVETRIRKL